MQTTSRGKCDPTGRLMNVARDCRGVREAATRKSPLRVEGEWSEYISSKGLIYYYHCRTEISQWQRPDEWTLPSMTHEEIKYKLACKNKSGITNYVKRNCPIILPQDLTSSSKRIKFNTSQIKEEKCVKYNNNFYPKITKSDIIKGTKVNVQACNNIFNNIKNKTNESNFNNDDMDISPNSSPMSRGSHSDDCEKKVVHFNFDSPKGQVLDTSNRNFDNIIIEDVGKLNTSPLIVESGLYTKSSSNNNLSITYKYLDNKTTTNISKFQMALVSTLRSILSLLQSQNENNKHEFCLSVAHISELLTKFEAVLYTDGTINNYRSHRLKAQLLNHSSFSNCQDPKVMLKLSANIYQIKELVDYIQGFIQDNYPHSISSLILVSPNYSKSSKTQYYMQLLNTLVETCILQLDPQSLTSPNSMLSSGSLKDNNSTLSLSNNSHLHIDKNTKSLSSFKKDESDKNKSILCDPGMLKFVNSDISNTYKNQLADFYVQEAQIEYYKFVRLHTVLYPELACESKKLKALVRISEINTELFKHKKNDLKKLVHMLELRRLPNHLKCDYLPSINS